MSLLDLLGTFEDVVSAGAADDAPIITGPRAPTHDREVAREQGNAR